MKYFRMSYEEVVSKRSYINIILLNRSIPSYKTDRDKIEERQDGEDTVRVKRDNRKFEHESQLFASLM